MTCVHSGPTRSLVRTQCTKAGQGSAANIRNAVLHAQPVARLLDKLRMLERQRCGDALLGCCLHHARLKAHLVHLGNITSISRAWHIMRDKLALTPADFLRAPCCHICMSCAAVSNHCLAHAPSDTKPERRSTAALLHI